MRESMKHLGMAAKYGLMPGVLPRIREFFGSGFAHFTFFMANVYKSVRLLPPSHPYLNPANRGRYGIWNVVAEARRNLVFRRGNIDQIIVFFTLLAGIALLVMQFGLLLVSVFVQSAWATGAWWASFFETTAPNDDLAFVTLDRVFGVPGIFNSRVAGGSDGVFPSPFHDALHELLSFYSIGIFAVAIVIIIYYVMTLVAETAQSGQPFGRRFNGWAPVRLILCIALLAPISNGMNIAQLGTLRVAKWSSGLATNGWITFNDAVLAGQTQLGLSDNLIAIPSRPSLNTLQEWVILAKTCVEMQSRIYGRIVIPYIVRTAPSTAGLATVGPDFEMLPGTPYATARNIATNGTMTIVVGEQDAAYTRDRWNIRPFCGVITMEVADVENDGVILLQERYYQLLQNQWADPGNIAMAEAIATRFTPTQDRFTSSGSAILTTPQLMAMRVAAINHLQTALTDARAQIQADAEWDDYGAQYGWAGAGIWYNRLAQYNGSFFEAVYNLPVPVRYPEAMEWVRERRGMDEEQVQPRDRYRAYRMSSDPDNPAGMIDFRDPRDAYIAQALYYVQTLWASTYVQSEENAILDYIQLIFGAAGLLNMRENIEAGVHPMAALVGIGSAMIQSTVINIGAGALGGLLGGIGNMTGTQVLATLGATISNISFKIALLGISVGFILYYIMPFLPFLYFTFAFGGWIKAVFEAMIGLPLWALAHLKIDGEGINGPMAMDGFYLVLEIFVRPIVIIFALVSSVSIFSALVMALNAVWDQVLANLTGHTEPITMPIPPTTSFVATSPDGGTFNTIAGLLAGARNIIDYLFYTVLYAIFVYVLGLSSFKMIDLVPNYVLRWMGKGLSTIGEGELGQDPGQSLLRSVSMGTTAVVDKFAGTSGSMMRMLAGR